MSGRNETGERRWWQRDRRRYSVWQVQTGLDGQTRRTRIVGGQKLKDAERDAQMVNGNLEIYKILAPSGPQDAHAVVELDEAPVSS